MFFCVCGSLYGMTYTYLNTSQEILLKEIVPTFEKIFEASIFLNKQLYWSYLHFRLRNCCYIQKIVFTIIRYDTISKLHHCKSFVWADFAFLSHPSHSNISHHFIVKIYNLKYNRIVTSYYTSQRKFPTQFD